MAPVSTLSFQCALITGGSGGLGRAMAEHLISMGKSVVIAGRTEDSLKKTAAEIGAKDYFVLDVGKVSTISAFVKDVLSKHADLDCLINNAGVQRPLQILGPDYTFDLDKADQEIDTNIRGPMHLTVELIPHFNSLPNGGVVMNVSSVLGYNPISIINPVYNGTKAWMHSFSMNLRTQLRNADSMIKVVEIVPPTVETALHRERKNPDDNKSRLVMRSHLACQSLWSKSWKAGRETGMFVRLAWGMRWCRSGMRRMEKVTQMPKNDSNTSVDTSFKTRVIVLLRVLKHLSRPR